MKLQPRKCIPKIASAVWLISAISLISGVSSDAFAYELGTHARMTFKAFAASKLTQDPQLLTDYGLDVLQDNPFGEMYVDTSGIQNSVRNVSGFENGFMVDQSSPPAIPPGTSPLSISGWLMRGAIREDDVPGEPQEEDPYGNIYRVFNHFYDPIFNRPLTVGGILPGSVFGDPNEPAPNWGIGTSNALTISPTSNAARRNHFAVFDAREAMYRALTGRDAQNNIVAPVESDRNQYWATTFRALGDVVHLLQDMAQPQHTRNEPHCGLSYVYYTRPGCGHKSVYEKYIEARATGSNFTVRGLLNGVIVDLETRAIPLVYDNDYPIPQFGNYVSYYTTRHLDAGIFDRRGLADYSNRGFFTAGKNLGDGEYPYPANTPGFYIPETINKDWAGDPLPNGSTVTLLSNVVPDTVNPLGSQGARLTTYGVWDQFLESNGFFKRYTLNRYNYDDMAALLIPRAVAYSAGLINYFFRGRIDFVADANNAGAYVIKNLGPEAMSGNFTLYYDAADGKRYPVPGDTPTTTWAGRSIAKSGQIDNLTFTVPTEPAPEVPGKYMLVFNGDMGEEKAIAGSTVGAVAAKYVEPERSGFLVLPNFTPADGIAGPRLIYWDGSQWKLSKEKGLQAGNVDWKGWYVSGKPTKLLSWAAPASKYGLNQSSGSFGPYVFQNGSIFAIAPCSVLGAALVKDSKGAEWLVVIGSSNGNVVYIRPNKKSLSAALHDPISNVNGWQKIGELTQDVVVDKAWAFNGNGNEAQVVAQPDGDKARRKLVIQFDESAGAKAIFSSVPYVSKGVSSSKNSPPMGTELPGTSTACVNGYESWSYGLKTTGGSDYAEGYTKLLAVDFVDAVEVIAEQNIKRGHGDSFTETRFTQIEAYGFSKECPLSGTVYYLPKTEDYSKVSNRYSSSLEEVKLTESTISIPTQATSGTDSVTAHSVAEESCGGSMGCGVTKTIEATSSQNSTGLAETNAYLIDLLDIRNPLSVVYRQSMTQPYLANPVHTELIDIHDGSQTNSIVMASQIGVPEACVDVVRCQGVGRLNYVPIGYAFGAGHDLGGRRLYIGQMAGQIIAPVGYVMSFTFLTGGQLETLLPGTGKPVYSFVGVIK